MNKMSLFSILVGCILIIATIAAIIYIPEPKYEPYIEKQIPLADDTNATAESVSTLVNSLNDFSFFIIF